MENRATTPGRTRRWPALPPALLGARDSPRQSEHDAGTQTPVSPGEGAGVGLPGDATSSGSQQARSGPPATPRTGTRRPHEGSTGPSIPVPAGYHDGPRPSLRRLHNGDVGPPHRAVERTTDRPLQPARGGSPTADQCPSPAHAPHRQTGGSQEGPGVDRPPHSPAPLARQKVSHGVRHRAPHRRTHRVLRHLPGSRGPGDLQGGAPRSTTGSWARRRSTSSTP